MRFIFSILLSLLLTNCSKPKTVLICGDHVCLNKTEAEQYFEENLSIEVKIVDDSNKKELDLVEINLNNKPQEKRKVSIRSKKSTNQNLKTLTKNEISNIKKKIKNKNKEKKISKKIAKKEIEKNLVKKDKILESKSNTSKIKKKNVNKKQNEIVDICTIIEKCSIDEISKYLLKMGKKKNFPDITKRQ